MGLIVFKRLLYFFLQVFVMNKLKLLISVCLFVFGCHHWGIGQDGVVSSSDVVSGAGNEQIDLNKNTLLTGSGEDRMKAVSLLLSDPNPLAGKILLEVLVSAENSEARAAICKTLIQSHIDKKPIDNKERFILPLLSVLRTGKDADSKLASETLLIFKYSRIGPELENLAVNVELPVGERLNVIYALQRQPDINAIFTLLDILDDPERQVSEASGKALTSLGIIGSGFTSTDEIVSELLSKGPNEFLRDLLVKKETRISGLHEEVKKWQVKHLLTLEELYASKKTEERGKFLAGYLSSNEKVVQLWALKKVEEWQEGTTDKSRLVADVGPVLLDQLSNPDRDVRLLVVSRISRMGKLNSAEKLYVQLEKEPDSSVRLELFSALGGACHYAFQEDTEISIPFGLKRVVGVVAPPI